MIASLGAALVSKPGDSASLLTCCFCCFYARKFVLGLMHLRGERGRCVLVLLRYASERRRWLTCYEAG